MKITFAEFYNFKHLYSALDKYKVTLDFKDMPNIINVIIGKMGSGKTTILSQLQPWASFGTLDERNSDGIILEGKDGYKKITIVDGNATYNIHHQWTWTKDHHSLKSFIMKNREELNPNGNQSSFKEIVEVEMGVDQNFLRLSRLGPNVSNIIEMTSAERKDFIAERLSDVDLYLSIYKDMNDRSRAITAQTQILSKKLQNVTDDSVAEMHELIEAMKDKADEYKDIIDSNMSAYHKMVGENHIYMDGLSPEEFRNQIEAQMRHANQIADEMTKIKLKIDEINLIGSPIELLKSIADLEALVKLKTQDIQTIQTRHDEYNNRKNQLIKTKSASVNSEYLASLSETYATQVRLVEALASELDGFECKYTSVELKNLIAEVQMFDTQLSDIFDYNRNSVIACLNRSEGDARKSITKNIESLRKRKFKLQKELNNIQFMGNYEVDEELRLPTCGCHKSCPYYRTHPSIMYKGVNLSAKHSEAIAEIEDIDARIDQLSEYPIICKKIEHLKTLFSELVRKLTKLGVLRINSLKTILTTSYNRVWYDSDALVQIMEKASKREQMCSIQVNLPQLKAEIDKYSDINIGNIDVELASLNAEIVTMKETILKIETELAGHKKEIARLYELNNTFIEAEAMNKHYQTLSAESSKINDRIHTMQLNYTAAMKNVNDMKDIKQVIKATEDKLKELNAEMSKVVNRLADIESSRKEFGDLLRQQDIINLIKEASSSKKGIPLVYVKIFLDDCVDIINELISMVFDDTIEIKEFNITDKDFFIPYYKNGIEIADVKTASQGERSIISLALSFALMRKSVTNYNILLLDEIDGALYSKDREKFLLILAQQIQAINAEQVFLITHNNIVDGGYPINLILTTPEHVDKNNIPMLYV